MADDTGTITRQGPTSGDGAAGDDLAERRSGGKVAPFVALGIAVALIGLVVLLVGADSDRIDDGAQSPLIGRPAPEAVGEFTDGTTFDLSRRKGSWVVLNFFQSSCIPCIDEHPELIDFVDQQEALGTDGAEFYTIVFSDTREAVQDFFDTYGGDWPVVYPTERLIPVAFGVNQVPETWVIDPDGVVQLRVQGTVDAESLGVVLQQFRESLR